MKNIQTEWCENFIRAAFTKHHAFPGGGIEVNLFWDRAEASGLWERGTYGSPMSEALAKLCRVETVTDDNRNYLYTLFRLKQPYPGEPERKGA